MTRSPLPLRATDLSSFARSLATQLGEASPSHLTLMNMLARAAGYQNVQHLRASHAAGERLSARDEAEPVDQRRVERALHQFDEHGRLHRWPSRRSVQDLALWAMWACLPAGRTMTEREVSERLAGEHLFQEPATLRRTMLGLGLVTRRRDGTEYRRVERPPPAEAVAVIGALSERRRARAAPR